MKDNKPFESLTKENFWNELFLTCPKSKDIFNKWLDNWKREHKWKTMFFVTKFHQIPVEMQYGIILQFIMEKSLCDLVIIPFVKGQKKAIPLSEYKQKLTNLFVKLEKQND